MAGGITITTTIIIIITTTTKRVASGASIGRPAAILPAISFCLSL
jgi:hypothetical protein